MAFPPFQNRFVSDDGLSLSLWYKVSGHGPALLVPTPGWGASSDEHMKSMTCLEEDFTLIFFDTRGSGRSDGPKKTPDMHSNCFWTTLKPCACICTSTAG